MINHVKLSQKEMNMHRCEYCGENTLVGEKFGSLKVIKKLEKKTGNHQGSLWECKCDCGNIKNVYTGALTSGNTKSCGCLVFKLRPYKYRKGYKYDIRKIIKRNSETEGTCWIWKKCRNADGYGIISYKGKRKGAHRVSYEVFKKEITEKIQVLHTCDNPSCVNPDHLWTGTQSDNMQDMHDKKRHSKRKKSEWGKPKKEIK